MIKSRKWAAMLFLPGFAGFALFWLYPTARSVAISMTNYIGNEFVFLRHYMSLSHTQAFGLAARNTLVVTGLAVLLTMSCSFIIAYCIDRYAKLRFLTYLMLLPFILSGVTVGYVWRSFFDLNGYANKMLLLLGLNIADWRNGVLAFVPLMTLFLWRYTGIGVFVFVAALRSIPQEHVEAYELESKSTIKRISKVLLPGIFPQTVFIFFIILMFSFSITQETDVLWRMYPPRELYILQNFISNNFLKLDYESAAAASTLFLLVVVIILASVSRLEKRFEP